MAATGARRVLRARSGRRRALGAGESVAATRVVAGHLPPRLPAAAQPAAAGASVAAHVLLRQAHRHVTPSRRRCPLFLLLFGGCRHLRFLHGGPQYRLQHEPQHDASPRQRRRRSRRAGAAAAAAPGARVGHRRGPAPRRAELQVHRPPPSYWSPTNPKPPTSSSLTRIASHRIQVRGAAQATAATGRRARQRRRQRHHWRRRRWWWWQPRPRAAAAPAAAPGARADPEGSGDGAGARFQRAPLALTRL